MRSSHQPSRWIGSCGPMISPARAVRNAVATARRRGSRSREGLDRAVLVVVGGPGRLVVLGPERAGRPVRVGVEAADERVAAHAAQRRRRRCGPRPGSGRRCRRRARAPSRRGLRQRVGVVAVAVEGAGALRRRAGDAAGEGGDLVAARRAPPSRRAGRGSGCRRGRGVAWPHSSRAAPPPSSRFAARRNSARRRRPGSTGTCGSGVDRAAASTICGDCGSPRRVHSRSARAPVRTSVSGGTTSRSARRVPPAQVRQTTPGSMLRKPPVRTSRSCDDELARRPATRRRGRR